MTTVLAVLGTVLGLGGIVAIVVEYLRRSISNSVTVDELTVATKLGADRVAAAEKAAADQRAERLRVFNAKADSATDSPTAARVLRDATSADDPTLN